jgi:hypothetical protein
MTSSTNGGGIGQNPFQQGAFQADQQLSDTISGGFQKQAEEYQQINEDNITDDTKKHQLENTVKLSNAHTGEGTKKKPASEGDPNTTFYAEQSQKGRETHASMRHMSKSEPFS